LLTALFEPQINEKVAQSTFSKTIRTAHSSIVRERKPMVAKVVFVEGIISAGKSTLIHKCLVPDLRAMGWSVAIIKEPVDRWVETGLLQLFYNETERWAYTFQTKAFYDRIIEAKNVFEQVQNTCDIILMERSPLSDRIFMKTLSEEGKLTPLENVLYKEWCDMWQTLLPFTPSLVVYLKTDLKTSMNRLKQRSRDGEGGVTEEYQARLTTHHDEVFDHSSIPLPNGAEVQCIVFDGTQEFAMSPKIRGEFISHLLGALQLSVC
jgi:deoxyadenosine/deoxycytidine kinase